MRGQVAGVLIVIGAGCAAAPVRRAPSESRAVDLAPSLYPSPARWDFHPATPTVALAGTKLPDGRCLFTSEGGVRWTSTTAKIAGSRLTCSGNAEASPVVVRDELTTILQRDGAWLFVGEGGNLHEATEPLGPLLRSVDAPEPLARVATSGSAVIAATADGKLVRWDPARGWSADPASAGLGAARIFDVAGSTNGRVLALAFPEALFASEDFGVTFRPANQPPIGARRIGSSPAGDVGAQGVVESEVWRSTGFARSHDRLLAPAPALAVDAGRAPSVSAIDAGRAVLEGDRYYEFFRDEPEGALWTLARGRLEGRLEVLPIPNTEPCVGLHIAGRGADVAIACTHAKPDDGADVVVEVRTSDDAGTTWSAPLALGTVDGDRVGLAVGAKGAVLITGVCKGRERSGCKPSAPFVLTRAPRDIADGGDADGGELGALRVLPSSAPQLAGAASSPVFSFDGRSAYLLGHRGKDDRVSIFVSHDGGTTFAPRAIDEPARSRTPDEPDEPDAKESEPDAQRRFDIDERTPIRAAEDGTIGFIATRATTSPIYVVADEDARVMQIARQPLDEEGNPFEVGFVGCGRRVLGYAYLQDGSGIGWVWESLDGGATWGRQPMPLGLVREFDRGGAIGSACSTGGCLLGDTLSRVGWGGALDSAGGPTPAPEDAPARAPPPPPGILCEVLPSSRWTRIEDIVPSNWAGQGAGGVPSAREMMRGRSVWSVVARDLATGAVTVVSATMPERGEGTAVLTRRPLLGPAAPNTATMLTQDDAEGYAALRVPFAPDKGEKREKAEKAEKAALRGIDLAWENLVEGVSGKARIADAGPVQAGDITVPAPGHGLFHPAMVAVRGRGLLVHPHAGKNAEGFFADVSGKVERFPTPSFPRTGPLGDVDLHEDGAVVDREPLEIAFGIQDGNRRFISVMTNRRGADGAWTLHADAIAPARSLVAITSWMAARPVGLVTLVVDAPNKQSWANFIGLHADGSFAAPEPAPILDDLGPHPRACSPAERAQSPRVVVPWRIEGTAVYEGAWPTITVTEPLAKGVAPREPLVLVAHAAVIHGKPGSACFAGWSAASVDRAPEGAAIPGDMTHSWLFRVVLEPIRADAGERRERREKVDARSRVPRPYAEELNSSEGTGLRRILEARPMTCHAQP